MPDRVIGEFNKAQDNRKLGFKSSTWYKDDPRYHINKRDNIVVLWFEPDYQGIWRAQSCTAHVDTKEGWDIWMNELWISAEDDWPKTYVWTFMPSRDEINA